MDSSVRFVENEASMILRSWREIIKEEANSLLFRLRVGAGLFVVPGVVFDFLQIPFQYGFSDAQLWLGVASSSAASAVMVGP